MKKTVYGIILILSPFIYSFIGKWLIDYCGFHGGAAIMACIFSWAITIVLIAYEIAPPSRDNNYNDW